MQLTYMSNEKPMGIAYPPRPLAEPRSGRYAGCKRVAVRYSAAYPTGAEKALLSEGSRTKCARRDRKGSRAERIVKVTPLPCGLSTMVLLYQ